MNDSKYYIRAGLAGTALLSAVALAVPLPQAVQGALFLSLGLVLTVLAAAYSKNLDTLNLQGRIIGGMAELHKQNNADRAAQTVEKTLERLFPRAELFLYPPSGDNSAPAMGWEAAMRFIGPSITEDTVVMASCSPGKQLLPEGVKNLAVLPLQGNVQAILLVNLPTQTSRRNLKLVLDTLHSHFKVVASRLQHQQQQHELGEEILQAAVAALESPDPLFCGHSARVAHMSGLIGKKLGLCEEDLQQLAGAAWLHDMGRWVTVADSDQPELDHASRGARFMPDTPSLAAVKSAVGHHHERYDGSGYPDGLKYTDIPMAARIIAVADIYDALTKLGAEGDNLEPQAALGVIKKAVGTQFDPLVVAAFEEAAAGFANQND